MAAVLVTATLWALYFGRDEQRAQTLFAEAEDRHHLVRDAFTYLHLPIVAGIVVVAVANELVIAHPDEQLPARELLALAVGPILRRRCCACSERSRVAGSRAPEPSRPSPSWVVPMPALATWSLALVVLAAVVLTDAREP